MKTIRHESIINRDSYTDYVCESFDIQDKEKSIVEIKSNLKDIDNFNWNIGVVYGGSGTGKTSILKNYFKKDIDDCNFDNNKALISNFDFLNPSEAGELLSSMGLSSIPTWLRPFNTLSNGEQYRARLAYVVGKAKENEVILIDEYTSVVDRDVAKAMSNALQKYIRRNNKKIVLASCHFDIMSWLLPDWTYSPIKGRVERTECLRQSRPTIELHIFRCRYETWDIFKSHHYLSEELNKASTNYIFIWNDKPVAFIAVLPMPSGTIKNAFRISRVVVLPDFQGLGIGIKILNFVASMYLTNDKKMYIKTSNPSLFKGMERNTKNWELVNESNNIESIKKNNKKLIEQGKDNGLKLRKESITKSYKYIGEKHEGDISIIKFKSEVYKNISQNQISLF